MLFTTSALPLWLAAETSFKRHVYYEITADRLVLAKVSEAVAALFDREFCPRYATEIQTAIQRNRLSMPWPSILAENHSCLCRDGLHAFFPRLLISSSESFPNLIDLSGPEKGRGDELTGG